MFAKLLKVYMAGRLWNEHLHAWLISLGYKQSNFDPCLYYDESPTDNKQIHVSIYVDDCIYVGDDDYVKEFERAIQ